MWESQGVQFKLDSYNMINGAEGIPEDGVVMIADTVNGVKVTGLQLMLSWIIRRSKKSRLQKAFRFMA